MKLIADGGAITKNATANTRDSIILGLNKPYIDGFRLNIYITKDNELVTTSEEIADYFEKNNKRIKDLPLRKLIGYNVGTKIHHQRIMTLKEVLEIFKSYNKDLILNLQDQGKDNALFIDLVLVTIRPYAKLNIYLESENKEIISYLQSSHSCHPIGAVVNENNIENWQMQVDFYDIIVTLLTKVDIRQKINNNKLIMIHEINRQEVFDLIYNEYKDIFNSIFIITSYIAAINYNPIVTNNNHNLESY